MRHLYLDVIFTENSKFFGLNLKKSVRTQSTVRWGGYHYLGHSPSPIKGILYLHGLYPARNVTPSGACVRRPSSQSTNSPVITSRILVVTSQIHKALLSFLVKTILLVISILKKTTSTRINCRKFTKHSIMRISLLSLLYFCSTPYLSFLSSPSFLFIFSVICLSFFFYFHFPFSFSFLYLLFVSSFFLPFSFFDSSFLILTLRTLLTRSTAISTLIKSEYFVVKLCEIASYKWLAYRFFPVDEKKNLVHCLSWILKLRTWNQ